MITTLNKIRAHKPCIDGWEKLLRGLGKTQADDEPLPITRVLEINGIVDALYCLRAVEGHDREIRLYAVWCARRVHHLMSDLLSIAALNGAERFARGEASDEERMSARLRAAAAARAATAAAWAVEAATAAAWAVEEAARAATAAAWAVQAATDPDAERAAQAAELRRICEEAKP